MDNRVEGCPSEVTPALFTVQDGILHIATTPNDTYWTTISPFNNNNSFHVIEAQFGHNGTELFSNFGECYPYPVKRALRENAEYILYYLTICNGIFMGILPMTLMITFNILVSK